MTEFDLISVLMKEVLVAKDDMYKLKEEILSYEATLDRITDIVANTPYAHEAIETLKRILEVEESIDA